MNAPATTAALPPMDGAIRPRRGLRRVAQGAAFIALLAAVGGLLEAAQRRRPSQVDAILDAPAVPAWLARRLSMGFTSAAADVTYLEAIQLYGDPKLPRRPLDERIRVGRALHRLLDFTTDLDPRFAYAFVFGANAIPLEGDNPGENHNVDETIALLEKGLRESLPDWRIPFHLAYLRSAYKGHFNLAAEAMTEAVRRGGGPKYLPFLATRLAAQGGAVETGIAFATAMAQNAHDPKQRDRFLARVKLLEMEGHLRLLEAQVEKFHQRKGRYPAEPAELIAAGLLKHVPPEPHEGAYRIDPLTGKVESTMRQRLRIFTNEAEPEPVEPEGSGGASAGTDGAP